MQAIRIAVTVLNALFAFLILVFVRSADFEDDERVISVSLFGVMFFLFLANVILINAA